MLIGLHLLARATGVGGVVKIGSMHIWSFVRSRVLKVTWLVELRPLSMVKMGSFCVVSLARN